MTNPAPLICGETALTPGTPSIRGSQVAASDSVAVRVRPRSATTSTWPSGEISTDGSSVSASMVIWLMSPTVRDKMNSASPPIRADMKMKMNTPTATPVTNRAVWALLAVR